MPDSNSIPDGFRVIAGFPRYAIDENGTILSVCYLNGKGKDMLWGNAIRINPAKDKAGYHIVTVRHDGHILNAKVHRLVLFAFVGPCPDGMQCRHLDGNNNNNHVSNLAWGTPRENQHDRFLHGTNEQGERCCNAKLTDADVLTIRARAASGEMQKDIAKDFHVRQAAISHIVRRRNWKHI